MAKRTENYKALNILLRKKLRKKVQNTLEILKKV
jgi:hypothetical protein